MKRYLKATGIVLAIAAFTYVDVFLGLLAASNVFEIGAAEKISTAQATAVAAIPSAVTVVRNAAQAWLKKNGTTLGGTP